VTRTHGETNDLADILVNSRVREEDLLARVLHKRFSQRLRDQLAARSSLHPSPTPTDVTMEVVVVQLNKPDPLKLPYP
jgi:hypothetical protein